MDRGKDFGWVFDSRMDPDAGTPASVRQFQDLFHGTSELFKLTDLIFKYETLDNRQKSCLF
jgi:hypothetical protein